MECLCVYFMVFYSPAAPESIKKVVHATLPGVVDFCFASLVAAAAVAAVNFLGFPLLFRVGV